MKSSVGSRGDGLCSRATGSTGQMFSCRCRPSRRPAAHSYRWRRPAATRNHAPCGVRRNARCSSGARGRCRVPRGHVVGDHRACARVRAVAETDRRDEHRVDADECAGADRRAVLVLAVVVGGDRSGADVGPLADVGIADVGQVRDLRAGADVRVLDLDERAGLRSLAQHGARAQVRERPDADPVADVGPVEIRVDDRRLVADPRVDQRRERTDPGAPADLGGAVEARERRDHGVLADRHVHVDHGRGRVDDRDAGEHVALVDPALRHRPDRRQSHPVVDAEFGGVADLVGEDAPLVRSHDLQHVGQVQLALGVVASHLIERRDQRRALERKDPRADLADPQLHLGGVAGRLGLDDALDRPVRRPHDPSVPARIIEHRGSERRSRARLGMRLRQPGERVRRDQRVIAVQHDDRVAPDRCIPPPP